MSRVNVASRTIFKRRLLVLLAIIVFAMALWLDDSHRPEMILAQADTFTPTVTPTFTLVPGVLATTTPLVSATKERRVVNEITEPKAGDAIAGVTSIIGTALVDSYHRYDLHISVAGMEDWQWLITSYEVVHDDLLLRLDTTAFPDGFYDLRSRALQDDGNYTEFYVRGVEIRNANPPTLTPPAPGQPVSPLSLIPTPTATPEIFSRVPNGQGFYAPDNGAVLRGMVDIVATVGGVLDNPFHRFELAITPAGQELWLPLADGEQQGVQVTIFSWDTTSVPDGLYDLRLRNVYRDSNYNEYYLRNLSVANQGTPQLAFVPQAGFTTPRSGDQASGITEFRGTVPEADLLRWELYWAPGASEEWGFLVSQSEAMSDGVLARLDLSQLSSGQYDFRLRIVRSDHNYTDYFIRGLRVFRGSLRR